MAKCRGHGFSSRHTDTHISQSALWHRKVEEEIARVPRKSGEAANVNMFIFHLLLYFTLSPVMRRARLLTPELEIKQAKIKFTAQMSPPHRHTHSHKTNNLLY